jgi:P27 family predicted phage terminase small subunit
MAGRPRKPLKVRQQEGDLRKIGPRKLQALIDAEPKTRSGLPDCPSHLRGIAREIWGVWVQELEIMDMDRMPDAVMLEGACVAYQRAVQADGQIDRIGITVERYKEIDGEAVLLGVEPNPAIKISEAAWKQVKSFCVEFGFSPASRSRLAVQKVDKPQDLMSILMADDPKAEAVQ